MTKTVGFIQSRGLGDLFIALPIALHYRENGYERILWPICEEFISTMTACAPWVEWIGIKTDPRGAFFYQTAHSNLVHRGCAEIICLYQFLSNMPELTDPDLFPILKFDQYKYAAAGVPFKSKQRLAQCITRDPAAEDRLRQQLVTGGKYIVVHTEGSDRSVNLDWSDAEQQGYQVIHIREGLTDNLVNWLGVIEGAESLYLLDSSVSNLVDGLDIHRDKWFIRRSKMDLTPVLLSDWQYFPLADLGK